MIAAPAGARRGVRRKVDFDCELIGSRSDRIHHYRVTNLSVEGLWLNTSNPARAGEHVVVCFRPNLGWQHPELQVFGEVVRVTSVRGRAAEPSPDVGMAVELLDLRSDEQDALRLWLAAQRAPLPRRRRPVRTAAVSAPNLSLPRALRPAVRSCWR